MTQRTASVATKTVAAEHLTPSDDIEQLCIKEIDGDGAAAAILDADHSAWRRGLTSLLNQINLRLIELKQLEATTKTQCFRLGSFEGQQKLARAKAGFEKERTKLASLRIRIEGKKRDVTALIERKRSFISPDRAEYFEACIRRIEQILDLDPLRGEELQKWLR